MIDFDDTKITVYDVAVKLQEKIKKYKGGGIKGVWENIDPRFKLKADSEGGSAHNKIKSLKDDNMLAEGNFRKQVDRLANKNLINVPMQLGLGKGKGNILLLLNVLDILEIRSISDLLGTSFRKPTVKEYIFDSNIRIKRTLRKLNDISTTLQIAMKKKSRFTAKKVSDDWLAVLRDLKEFIDPPRREKSISEIVNPDQVESYIKSLSPQSQFVVRFHTIQNKYRQYFFNDVLLHRFNEEINKLDKAKYDSNNMLCIISPLFALYFLSLMYKRYLYYLSNEIRDEARKKNRSGKINPTDNLIKHSKFSFISDENINKENKYILGDKELGEYIYIKFVSLNNLMRRLIQAAMKLPAEIFEEKFNEYLNIFKEVFSLLYEMNIEYTKNNQDWLDINISKINTLEMLYKRMVLGISYVCQPTINHINRLNEQIQTIEKIADIIEAERR